MMMALDAMEKDTQHLNSLCDEFEFMDDVSFKQLDKALAITAQQEEFEFCRNQKVYYKVQRSKAYGHKNICTK